jgi:hypothetical protein
MHRVITRIPLHKGIFVLFRIQKRVINNPGFGINQTDNWQMLKTLGGWYSPHTRLNCFFEF